jgi:hypothetical protein
MAGTTEKRIRIGAMQGIFMIGVALTIDGVQFLINLIPLVGWIIASILSIGVALMFWYWFKLNGVSFLRGKAALLRVATISTGTIVEIIPIFNSLPAWTATVVVMLIIVKLEDEMYNVKNKLKGAVGMSNKKSRTNTRRNRGFVKA